MTLALLGAAALAAGCGDSGDDGPDAFRLGLEAPLSGEQASLGEGMLKGAELAAAELNERDGLLGREIEIVPIDDAADPATGVEAAEEAIVDGLDGIVGPYNSAVGVETLPLYIDAGLTPIRLTSDPSTSGLGFTLQPMSYQIAPVAARALRGWLGAESVAIAYDATQNFTVSVSRELKRSLEAGGVEVTAYAPLRPGGASYAGLVERLAAAAPDAIYAATYFPEGGLIARAMRERGVESQCVAGYASYDAGFVEAAGVAAARACPVIGVPAPGDFPGAAARVAAYEERFDAAPGVWSPYAYDSVRFLADGAERAEGTAPTQLNKVLGAAAGWRGWTGSVTIDPESGDRRPATVTVVATDADGELHVDPDWAEAVGAPYRR